MEHRAPFRNVILGPIDASSLQTINRILEAMKHGEPLAGLTDIIRTANEVVLWQLAAFVQVRSDDQVTKLTTKRGNQWSIVASLLVERALADADKEGLVWTPLLDALADSSIWPSEATSHLPSPADRAGKLVPWISEQRDVEAVRPLFAFRSQEVIGALIQYCRALPVVELFPHLTRPALVKRFCLSPIVGDTEKDKLYRYAFDNWRRKVHVGDDTYGTDYEIMITLNEEGVPLPADILQVLVAWYPTVPSHSALAYNMSRLLASDPGCPESLLRSMGRWPGTGLKAIVAGNPNCPRDLYLEIVNGSLVVLQLLDDKQLSEEQLKEIEKIHYQSYSPFLAQRIARQQNAGADLWLRAALSFTGKNKNEILLELAKNPSARRHPEIRRLLMKSNSKLIVSILLKDGDADEFEQLMTRYIRLGCSEALDFLRKNGLPEGLGIPRRLAEELLKSDSQEARLLGISLLGQHAENVNKTHKRKTDDRRRL